MELRTAIVIIVILAIALFIAISLWAACALSGHISDQEESE